MPTKKEIKVIIRKTVKDSVIGFAKRQLHKKDKFQILDLLIPKERKIRSIVGGLETSIGDTLWEPLGKALAAVNGFEVVTQKLLRPSIMPSILNNTLQTVLEERIKAGGLYDAKKSHKAIKDICASFKKNPIENFIKPTTGKDVDIWLRKNGINYFFDTKTVQPNISALNSFVDQVLHWYAYFYSRYPTGKAEARIVFPYNPHNGNFWDKIIKKGFPLEQKSEAWVANEFWDFCSGVSNTTEIIFETFREISTANELEKEIDSLFDMKGKPVSKAKPIPATKSKPAARPKPASKPKPTAKAKAAVKPKPAKSQSNRQIQTGGQP
jgi:hypothetical protein